MYKILYLLYLCRGQIKVSMLFLICFFFLFQSVKNLIFYCFYLQHQQTCETDGKANHILPLYFHYKVVYFRF